MSSQSNTSVNIETPATTTSDSSIQKSHTIRKQCAISKDGSEYRTFKLHSVNDHSISKEFHAKNERPTGSSFHIGGSRAASKIFNSYCSHFGVDVHSEITFKIVETTNGIRNGKLYTFKATREELATPSYLEKVDGKLVVLSSPGEASNPKNVIEYRYKNKITSVREED